MDLLLYDPAPPPPFAIRGEPPVPLPAGWLAVLAKRAAGRAGRGDAVRRDGPSGSPAASP